MVTSSIVFLGYSTAMYVMTATKPQGAPISTHKKACLFHIDVLQLECWHWLYSHTSGKR